MSAGGEDHRAHASRDRARGTRRDRARGSRQAARLLLACVRDDAWQAPSPVVAALAAAGPMPALPAAAAFHGVAGYAWRALRRAGGPAVAPVELEALRAGALHTHFRALGDLPLIGEALEGAGIPWLVVKGPVLAALHGAPDLRAYGDLDVVVPAAGFPDALGSLEAAGARGLARNWWHRLDVLAGEVPLVLPSGTLVDLHWHLLNDLSVRHAFDLAMPALFARARDTEVDGHVVSTLGGVDAALALLLHTASSGGNRLVWLKDVERLLAVEDPDAAAVAAAAADAGLALVAATVIAKTAATLRTDAGRPILDALEASRTWRAVAALARRLPPPERARPGASVDRVVSRATRRDLRSSARELLHRTRRWGPAPRRARPGRAAPVAATREEAAGRRAFLAAVARQP